MLLLSYFSALPEPLITGESASKLLEAAGELKSLTGKQAFDSTGSDAILSVPVHLLQSLIIPLLQRLPGPNFQTLRKLSRFLADLHQHKSESENRLLIRRELAHSWSGAVFGRGKAGFDDQARQLRHRVFLLELLIERFDVVFSRKSVSRRGSQPAVIQLQSVAIRQSSLEAVDRFPIDVFVGVDESQVISKRIPNSTTVTGFVQQLIIELQARAYPEQIDFSDCALFEISHGMERLLGPKEVVFDVVQSWPSPQFRRIAFKSSPILSYMAAEQMRPVSQSAWYSGWLRKEGVSIRSWKRRFFVLKKDALYYYRDDKCTEQSLIGILNYRDLGIFLLRQESKYGEGFGAARLATSPSPFCFCIRNMARHEEEDDYPRFLCADSAEEMFAWVSAIIYASTGARDKMPLQHLNIAALRQEVYTPPRVLSPKLAPMVLESAQIPDTPPPPPALSSAMIFSSPPKLRIHTGASSHRVPVVANSSRRDSPSPLALETKADRKFDEDLMSMLDEINGKRA